LRCPTTFESCNGSLEIESFVANGKLKSGAAWPTLIIGSDWESPTEVARTVNASVIALQIIRLSSTLFNEQK
jgi:hypothetical protein